MAARGDNRTYYIFDSFEGFPKFSKQDPAHLQNAYASDYPANRIFNMMRLYAGSRLYPGFVPETFKRVPESERFSVVLYDCDLYQPALDTYRFFWDKLQPGGILLIHDNIAANDGWTGVGKATAEFFNDKPIQVHDFWETTMSVVIKP